MHATHGHILREGARIFFRVDGSGAPIVLLHGFLGSSQAWSGIIPGLIDRYRCITVDLVGHGQSDAPDEPARYSMMNCVRDVCAVLSEVGVDRTAVIGYSMGGRVALHLSVAAGTPVKALVCESTSPGIQDGPERMERAKSDDELARKIEIDGMESFVDWWEQLPLFASQSRLDDVNRMRLRKQRTATKPTGAANSLRGTGTGRHDPLWNVLGKLKVPTLIVAGADDEKYSDIALRMEGVIEGAEVRIVEEAGHTVHLEKPAEFLATVSEFLDRTWKSGRRDADGA